MPSLEGMSTSVQRASGVNQSHFQCHSSVSHLTVTPHCHTSLSSSDSGYGTPSFPAAEARAVSPPPVPPGW